MDTFFGGGLYLMVVFRWKLKLWAGHDHASVCDYFFFMLAFFWPFSAAPERSMHLSFDARLHPTPSSVVGVASVW